MSVWCRCFGEDKCISIVDIKALVMVLVPSEPQISITGTEHVTIPAAELRAPLGVALFKEIHIISTVTRSNGTFSLGNTHVHTQFNIFCYTQNAAVCMFSTVCFMRMWLLKRLY